MRTKNWVLGLDISDAAFRLVALEVPKETASRRPGTVPPAPLRALEIPGEALPSRNQSAAVRGPVSSMGNLGETLRTYRGSPVAYHRTMPGEFLTVLSLPPVPANQEARLIRWEVQRLLPAPVEEYAIDFARLEAKVKFDGSSASTGNRYVIYGAPWASIRSSAEIVRSLGLKPVKAFPGAVASLLGADYLLRLSGQTLENHTCVAVFLEENSASVSLVVSGVPVAARMMEKDGMRPLSETFLTGLLAEVERTIRYARRISGSEPECLYIIGSPDECREARRAVSSATGHRPVVIPEDLPSWCEGFPRDGRFVRALGLALSLRPERRGRPPCLPLEPPAGS